MPARTLIKILHVSTGLNPGGAELMLHRLLEHSDRATFAHSVVTLIHEGEVGRRLQSIDVPVNALGMKRSRPSIRGLLGMIHLVREYDPDLIQGWMYHGSLFALWGAWFHKRRVPVLWNIRGDHTNLRAERPLTSATIRLCARLSRFPQGIINNSFTSMRGHKVLGFRPARSVVIPNGFDTDKFAPDEMARQKIRGELGLPPATILLGHVGRYYPVKDHETLLQAAAIVLREYPSVHFALIGEDVTWENDTLAGTISRLGISKSVHLLGVRTDISEVNAGFDVAISSSRSEGFCNAIAEAMSCGAPCVVTDVGDSAWIVGDTGRVVPSANPAKLAQALSELVTMGQENRRQLGLSARFRVLENFSLANAVNRYEELYKSMLVGAQQSPICSEAESRTGG